MHQHSNANHQNSRHQHQYHQHDYNNNIDGHSHNPQENEPYEYAYDERDSQVMIKKRPNTAIVMKQFYKPGERPQSALQQQILINVKCACGESKRVNKVMYLDMDLSNGYRRGFPGKKKVMGQIEAIQRIKGNDVASKSALHDLHEGTKLDVYTIFYEGWKMHTQQNAYQTLSQEASAAVAAAAAASASAAGGGIGSASQNPFLMGRLKFPNLDVTATIPTTSNNAVNVPVQPASATAPFTPDIHVSNTGVALAQSSLPLEDPKQLLERNRNEDPRVHSNSAVKTLGSTEQNGGVGQTSPYLTYEQLLQDNMQHQVDSLVMLQQDDGSEQHVNRRNSENNHNNNISAHAVTAAAHRTNGSSSKSNIIYHDNEKQVVGEIFNTPSRMEEQLIGVVSPEQVSQDHVYIDQLQTQQQKQKQPNNKQLVFPYQVQSQYSNRIQSANRPNRQQSLQNDSILTSNEDHRTMKPRGFFLNMKKFNFEVPSLLSTPSITANEVQNHEVGGATALNGQVQQQQIQYQQSQQQFQQQQQQQIQQQYQYQQTQHIVQKSPSENVLRFGFMGSAAESDYANNNSESQFFLKNSLSKKQCGIKNTSFFAIQQRQKNQNQIMFPLHTPIDAANSKLKKSAGSLTRTMKKQPLIFDLRKQVDIRQCKQIRPLTASNAQESKMRFARSSTDTQTAMMPESRSGNESMISKMKIPSSIKLHPFKVKNLVGSASASDFKSIRSTLKVS